MSKINVSPRYNESLNLIIRSQVTLRSFVCCWRTVPALNLPTATVTRRCIEPRRVLTGTPVRCCAPTTRKCPFCWITVSVAPSMWFQSIGASSSSRCWSANFRRLSHTRRPQITPFPPQHNVKHIVHTNSYNVHINKYIIYSLLAHIHPYLTL